MGEPGKSYYTRRDIQTAATTPKVCWSWSCCCTPCRCLLLLLFFLLFLLLLLLLLFFLHFSPLIFSARLKCEQAKKGNDNFVSRGNDNWIWTRFQLRLTSTLYPSAPPVLFFALLPSSHSAPPPPFVGFNKRIAAHSQHIKKMRQNNEKCLKIAMLLQCFPCPPPPLPPSSSPYSPLAVQPERRLSSCCSAPI